MSKKEIFENAKRLYSAHRSYMQLNSLALRDSHVCKVVKLLLKQMGEYEREIISLGGQVIEEKDAFGMPRPQVITDAEETINYDVGRIDSEKFLNNFQDI